MRTGKSLAAERVLVDTHALLWWQADGGRLSGDALRSIARATAVLVSPISIWETGMLLRKGRVRIDRDLHAWTRDLFDDERVGLAPLSPHAAASAALLEGEFPGDPVDRLLYATALDLGAPLISKDERLRGYAQVRSEVVVLW